MTQEEKDLLLMDLCARLQYGVKVQVFNYGIETIENLYQIDLDGYISTIEGNELKYSYKPYLFPLSSMTEEQKIIYGDFVYEMVCSNPLETQKRINEFYDWLNKNHFDYRDLIEKNLAIDATGKNIY